jgi:hypothetical protein
MNPITRFQITRDNAGFTAFGLPISNRKYQTVLTALTEQILTVPISGDATYPGIVAVFSFQPGTTVWMAINATATVPGGSFTLTNSEQNPQVRYLKAGDIIHMISRSTTSEVGVMFYATY